MDQKPLKAILSKSLLKASQWMQLLLMKTIPYDMVMQYIPAPTNVVVDCLSRAPITSDRIQLPILQVHKITNALKCTADCLQQLCEKTIQDDTLALLKHTIQAGWPEKIQQVPPEIQAHWTLRDELTIEDGLILRNTRIVILTSERNDLLRQIHHGHLGTIKCQLHAKETICWPGITKDIEDMVQNCETCLKFSANNCKPKPVNTLRHEVPIIPCTKLAMDIFTFDNENYLLVVDYTSKFPVIHKLPSMTARVVTEVMKSIISEEGHPATIVSDNGPCCDSEYFTQEMQKYGIQHMMTLPHYPQSNEFAKAYVKTAKEFSRKPKRLEKIHT